MRWPSVPKVPGSNPLTALLIFRARACGTHGVRPCKGWRVMASLLERLYKTPLSLYYCSNKLVSSIGRLVDKSTCPLPTTGPTCPTDLYWRLVDLSNWRLLVLLVSYWTPVGQVDWCPVGRHCPTVYDNSRPQLAVVDRNMSCRHQHDCSSITNLPRTVAVDSPLGTPSQ